MNFDGFVRHRSAQWQLRRAAMSARQLVVLCGKVELAQQLAAGEERFDTELVFESFCISSISSALPTAGIAHPFVSNAPPVV